MKSFRYLLSLIPSLLVIFGNLAGGNWVWLNSIYCLIVMVAMDWLSGENSKNNHATDSVPNLIMILHVVFHFSALGTLLFAFSSGTIHGISLAGAILSTGLNSGISGIIPAHELIHRSQTGFRILGILNLFSVNYGHFYIEHIKGHHKNIGTKQDPATARRGESIYAFIFRTIPGQWMNAYRIEKQNEKWYNNFVFQITFLQFLFCLIVFFKLGFSCLVAYLLQGLLAVVLLEYVNYIEHYGLKRDPGQKVGIHHSWQSDVLSSRLTLLELSRHPDHHHKASRHYQHLASHAESPKLPSGYFGVFYFVFIPAIWFRIIHPIIDKHPYYIRKNS